MSVNFYFDGCSYVDGHDRESFALNWTHYMNPIGQDPWLFKNSSLLKEERGPGRRNRYIDESTTAKSNDAIFYGFLTNLEWIKKYRPTIFIQFSHSERYMHMQFTDEEGGWSMSEEKDWFSGYYKNLFDITNIDLSGRQLKGAIEGANNIFMGYWLINVNKTLSYIKAIQQICKDNDLDLNLITTENYNIFKKAASYSEYTKQLFDSIDHTNIFNWPSPDFINYDLDNVSTWLHFLSIWGTVGFPVQWSKAFGKPLADDNKHLSQEGFKLFANQIKEWCYDRSKDLSYQIDKLPLEQKQYMYDYAHWVRNYDFGNTSHWVEEDLHKYFNTKLKFIIDNADYVYES